MSVFLFFSRNAGFSSIFSKTCLVLRVLVVLPERPPDVERCLVHDDHAHTDVSIHHSLVHVDQEAGILQPFLRNLNGVQVATSYLRGLPTELSRELAGSNKK